MENLSRIESIYIQSRTITYIIKQSSHKIA